MRVYISISISYNQFKDDQEAALVKFVMKGSNFDVKVRAFKDIVGKRSES